MSGTEAKTMVDGHTAPDRKPGISTLASEIYESLLGKIVTGELRPGLRLEEKIVAAQFNVSRTPVREAFRELAARQLIEFRPRKGAEVTNLGVERLADMMEGECELEALCAKLASQRMSTLEKRQLREVHERAEVAAAAGDLAGYFDLNTSFHDLICAGVHNGTLDHMARDLRQRLSPFRRPLEHNREGKMRVSHGEHAAILEAIFNSEPEAAYRAMRDHNARVNASAISFLRNR